MNHGAAVGAGIIRNLVFEVKSQDDVDDEATDDRLAFGVQMSIVC
jgi:hypothetical protein